MELHNISECAAQRLSDLGQFVCEQNNQTMALRPSTSATCCSTSGERLGVWRANGHDFESLQKLSKQTGRENS